MEVRIQSIHFDASEQLQSFVQKKVAKLEKFYDDIKKVEVSLKVVKPETAENKEAGGKYWFPMASFMQTRFVIRLKKQWIYAWKLWKNSWLSTRKSNGANNFPLKFCG